MVSANAVSNIHPFIEYAAIIYRLLKNIFVFIVMFITFFINFSMLYKRGTATKKLKYVFFFMPVYFKLLYFFYSAYSFPICHLHKKSSLLTFTDISQIFSQQLARHLTLSWQVLLLNFSFSRSMWRKIFIDLFSYIKCRRSFFTHGLPMMSFLPMQILKALLLSINYYFLSISLALYF